MVHGSSNSEAHIPASEANYNLQCINTTHHNHTISSFTQKKTMQFEISKEKTRLPAYHTVNHIMVDNCNGSVSTDAQKHDVYHTSDVLVTCRISIPTQRCMHTECNLMACNHSPLLQRIQYDPIYAAVYTGTIVSKEKLQLIKNRRSTSRHQQCWSKQNGTWGTPIDACLNLDRRPNRTSYALPQLSPCIWPSST
jgi:hypothetical protein